MTLQTVTLTWNLADLIQDGITAVLTIWPTAREADGTDSVIITTLPQQVAFTGGTGLLAGIVANDNAALAPSGQAYNITVDTQGTVLVPGTRLLQMTAAINRASGATQDLSGLVPVQPSGAFAAYLPLQYAPGAALRFVWTSDADGNGSWQAASAPVVQLADAPVIAVNAALGSDLRVTLQGSRELGSPTRLVDGQKLLFQVTQGTGGGFTLSYGTAYEFSSALPAQPLSTAEGATDLLGFVYNAARGKLLFAAYLPGF